MTKCNYIYTKTHRKQRWILVNRVMIWGWFGFENTGDDLLLKTMLSFFWQKRKYYYYTYDEKISIKF